MNNLVVLSNQAHVKVDTVRGEIASIDDPGSGSTTIVLSQGLIMVRHIRLKLAILIVIENTSGYNSYARIRWCITTVTAVTNSSAFIASSGSDVALKLQVQYVKRIEWV